MPVQYSPKHCRATYSQFGAQSGSVFTEAAIVLPVLLVLLLGFIDFFRYQSVKASLAYAAQSALSYATTVPGLESVDNLPAPNGVARPIPTTAAIYQAYKIAKDQAKTRSFGATLVGPDSTEIEVNDNQDKLISTIVLPAPVPATGPNLEKALGEQPIVVTLRAKVPALMMPFLSGYPVVASAVGFRELRQKSSNTVYLACDGKPFIPGKALSCACGAGRTLNAATGLCECSGCTAPDATLNPATCACTCPPGMAISGNSCVCTQNPATCAPPHQIVTVGNSCVCQCPAGQHETNGSCCPFAQTYNVATSTCECPACAAGFIQDLNTCACTCPEGQAPSGGICCPIGQVNIAGVCGCANPPTCASTDQTVGTNCTCQCPAGTTLSGERCCPAGQVASGDICCPEGQVNLGNGSCGCQPPVNCTAPQVPQSNCTCSCPAVPCSGGTVNATSCACECPSGQTQQGGVCGCYNPPSCPSPQVVGSDCTCQCPPGQGDLTLCCPAGRFPTEFNGVRRCCLNGQHNSQGICCNNGYENLNGHCCNNIQGSVCCQPGQVAIPGVDEDGNPTSTCGCPAGRQWSGFTNRCECAESSTCPIPGQQRSEPDCVCSCGADCPAGQVRAPNSCACGCPMVSTCSTPSNNMYFDYNTCSCHCRAAFFCGGSCRDVPCNQSSG